LHKLKEIKLKPGLRYTVW